MSKSGESRFWRTFHARFKALATEEATIQRLRAGTNDRHLRAHADYTTAGNPNCGDWVLSEGPNEDLRARFEALATRAGVKLRPPQGTAPLDYWLHRLFLNLLNNKSPQLFAAQEHRGGIIRRVCEASATFCSRLETEALGGSTDRWEQRADVTALQPVLTPGSQGDRKVTPRAGKSPGRPRLDSRANEAIQLRSQGLSWRKIGRKLKVTPDSIRKLVASRTHPPGENPRRKPPEETLS